MIIQRKLRWNVQSLQKRLSYLHLRRNFKSSSNKISSGRLQKSKKNSKHIVIGSLLSSSDVILQTFTVVIIGPKGDKRIRVMLDGGAHHSQRLVIELGLKQGVEHQTLSTFGRGYKEHAFNRRQVTLRTYATTLVNKFYLAFRLRKSATQFLPSHWDLGERRCDVDNLI